jgi:NADPH-dependent 2,4-dienoyl-CoA reductase/sulfur reductase-like enzyme
MSCDVAVIGAGPAGLTAATTAAGLGLATVLIDEQPAPGGQIYRAIEQCAVPDRRVLGDDYWHGATLVDAFRASGARYMPGTAVWNISPERELALSRDGKAELLPAGAVIAATGALERPFPIPGWTLPGVMSGGAAQILLKASGLVPDKRTVLAGTGPLLYLLAQQLRAAGATLAAVLDIAPPANRNAALRYLPGFLVSPYLLKGLALLRAADARRGVEELRASGDAQLRQVAWRDVAGAHTLDADLLLLHQGVVPNVNLSVAIGCAHDWDAEQLCWRPRLDGWGASTVDGVYIAGDGAGIGGAEAAAARGRLAAFDAARRLGRIDAARRDAAAAPVRRALDRALRGRNFLDLLFRPPDWSRLPSGDTVVCRCEEVSASQVLDAVAIGCTGPNQAKAFLRCGMGPCQGRQCALTVQALIARARDLPEDAVGHLRLRPPVKPVTLAEIASLPKSEAAVKAVVRG